MVQNEVIEMFAGTKRQVIADLLESPFYGLIADGTTDETEREQFYIVLYANSTVDNQCVFLVFYNPPDSSDSTGRHCSKS